MLKLAVKYGLFAIAGAVTAVCALTVSPFLGILLLVSVTIMYILYFQDHPQVLISFTLSVTAAVSVVLLSSSPALTSSQADVVAPVSIPDPAFQLADLDPPEQTSTEGEDGPPEEPASTEILVGEPVYPEDNMEISPDPDVELCVSESDYIAPLSSSLPFDVQRSLFAEMLSNQDLLLPPNPRPLQLQTPTVDNGIPIFAAVSGEAWVAEGGETWSAEDPVVVANIFDIDPSIGVSSMWSAVFAQSICDPSTTYSQPSGLPGVFKVDYSFQDELENEPAEVVSYSVFYDSTGIEISMFGATEQQISDMESELLSFLASLT